MKQGNPPWNFKLIGELPRITAPWMVDVKKAGRYRFTLRQYPKLADKPVVAVSSVTGAGIPEFTRTLDDLCGAIPERKASGLFRLPVDRVFGVGAGLERPCFGFVCHASLNYVDLGDGALSEDGGPLLGSIEGSFSSNWAVALDFQLRKRF